MPSPIQTDNRTGGADEYLKTHKSAKWCPVCGMIYLLRFAPVLTITGLIIAVIIGGCMGHHAAIR